jgi:Leucine-rich repeat (LRR) protein
LKELPSSFKALAKLEEFRGCHNQIEELGEIAGRELKRLFVSHNKISSVALPTKKWMQLEEINLSNNCLEIADSELALWTVRFKKLIRLDYRPQTSHSTATTTTDRKVTDAGAD